jgi:hypothetical protein
MSAKEMQEEMAERAEIISDTSNMSMFDSSMSRQEISEHMQSIIDRNGIRSLQFEFSEQFLKTASVSDVEKAAYGVFMSYFEGEDVKMLSLGDGNE